VAKVEKATSENDGAKPSVTCRDDNNIYNSWQLDSNIKAGKTFKFKYYENSELLCLIEEVVD